MSSLNRAQLIGHLGRDPEVRYTHANKKIVQLSVATTEKWKDQRGEMIERTEWHRVVIFNEGLAGVAERFLRKGSQLFVEGQIRTRKWTDQGGAERYSTEIVLAAFQGQLVLLGRPNGDGDRGDGGNAARAGSARSDPAESYGDPSSGHGRGAAADSRNGPGPGGRGAADLDDDIPF